MTPPREEVDELAALRARGAGQNDGGGDLGAELGHPGRQSEESARKKDKKKKKKKKERSKEEKQISGKHPARAVQKVCHDVVRGHRTRPEGASPQAGHASSPEVRSKKESETEQFEQVAAGAQAPRPHRTRGSPRPRASLQRRRKPGR